MASPALDWNTFGARRGNHEVMMRGTFGNVRIKNRLVPDRRRELDLHLPIRRGHFIYDAAMRTSAGHPLVLLAGKEYGTGSAHVTGPPRAPCCSASRQ